MIVVLKLFFNYCIPFYNKEGLINDFLRIFSFYLSFVIPSLWCGCNGLLQKGTE